MSCPYKYIFGIPEKGFHEKRIAGYALYDTLGTIGLALLTSWFFKINVWLSLVAWFVSGEVLHWAFGLQSAFLTTLGIKAC